MKKLCALLLLLICFAGCTQTPGEEPTPTPEATAEHTVRPVPTRYLSPTPIPLSPEEKAALYTQLNKLIDTIPTEPMDISKFPKKVLVKQKKGTTLYFDENLTDHGTGEIYYNDILFSGYECCKGVYKLQSSRIYRRGDEDEIHYFIFYGYTKDFEIVEDPIDFYKYHENFEMHTYTIGDKTFEQAFLMETKLTLRDGSYIRCAQYRKNEKEGASGLFYYAADGSLISTLYGVCGVTLKLDYCVQTDLNRDGLPDLILLASGYTLEPREGYDNPFLSGDKVFEVNQMEQLEKLRTEEGVETYLASEARGGSSCVLLSDAADGTYSYYNSYRILPISTFARDYVPFVSEVNKVTAELFEGAEKNKNLP